MTSPPNTSAEVLIIRPRRGLSPINLKLMWQFRDLLWAFAERDVRLRYRQTVLGAAWVILQPLMGASIFSIVFGLIAKMPSNGTPYFVISFSGLLGWTLFFGVLSRVHPSLVANAPIITKIFFPRLLIPLGVIPSVMIDFLVALAVMVALLVAYRIVPGIGLLTLPLSLLTLLLMSLGIGLIAASLAVKYRDIGHIIPFLSQLLMYASPVGYSVEAVPERLKTYYFILNPLAAPIDMVRWSLINTGKPHFAYLFYSLAVSIFLLAAGLFVFNSVEREFADVI